MDTGELLVSSDDRRNVDEREHLRRRVEDAWFGNGRLGLGVKGSKFSVERFQEFVAEGTFFRICG